MRWIQLRLSLFVNGRLKTLQLAGVPTRGFIISKISFRRRAVIKAAAYLEVGWENPSNNSTPRKLLVPDDGFSLRNQDLSGLWHQENRAACGRSFLPRTRARATITVFTSIRRPGESSATASAQYRACRCDRCLTAPTHPSPRWPPPAERRWCRLRPLP